MILIIIAHYFDALFWHPHASSQHYVPVSPLRAIQFQMRWEHRRLSALRWAQTRDHILIIVKIDPIYVSMYKKNNIGCIVLAQNRSYSIRI